MTLSPHLQAALDRIDEGVRRAQRSAKKAHVLSGALRYFRDPEARTRTLHRLAIADGDHRAIIAAARERLALDTVLRRTRPFDPPAPIRRWSLLAVWIGERRLSLETRRLARRFASLPLTMAAA